MRAALNDVQEAKLMLHVGAEDAPTASTPSTSPEPWDVDLAKNALTEPDQVDEQHEGNEQGGRGGSGGHLRNVAIRRNVPGAMVTAVGSGVPGAHIIAYKEDHFKMIR